MDKLNNSKSTPTKRTAKNGINLDYDYNTEYGDGDIPNIDKPKSSNANNDILTDMEFENDPDIE